MTRTAVALHVDPRQMPHDSGVNFDWHRHRCATCGTVWAHDGSQTQTLSDADYTAAHTCPRCRTEARGNYWCL